MRNLIADWALRRARKAARTASEYSRPPAVPGRAGVVRARRRRAEAALATSEFWHDVAAWLDGLGSWDDLRDERTLRLERMRKMSRTEVKAWLLVWGAVGLLACGVLAGGCA